MIALTNLTNAAKQFTTVKLADGTTLALTFAYQGATQRWTVSVSRLNFTALNVGLCVQPNLLRAFRNTQPFGLACLSQNGADPFDINDFSSGRVAVYVLDNTSNQNEVDEVERDIFGSSFT